MFVGKWCTQTTTTHLCAGQQPGISPLCVKHLKIRSTIQQPTCSSGSSVPMGGGRVVCSTWQNTLLCMGPFSNGLITLSHASGDCWAITVYKKVIHILVATMDTSEQKLPSPPHVHGWMTSCLQREKMATYQQQSEKPITGIPTPSRQVRYPLPQVSYSQAVRYINDIVSKVHSLLQGWEMHMLRLLISKWRPHTVVNPIWAQDAHAELITKANRSKTKMLRYLSRHMSTSCAQINSCEQLYTCMHGSLSNLLCTYTPTAWYNVQTQKSAEKCTAEFYSS